MRTNRWKMMAGGVVFSIGGVLAAIGMPSKGCVSAQSDPAILNSRRLPEPTLPTTTVPTLPAPVLLAEPVIAPVPVASPVVPIPAPICGIGIPEPIAPLPLPKTGVTEMTLPLLAEARPVEVPPMPVVPRPIPEPVDPVIPRSPVVVVPMTEVKPLEVAPPVLVQVSKPADPEMPKSGPSPRLGQMIPPAVGEVATLPRVTVPTHDSLSDRKLRVLIVIGDGRPRMEVRDGEEILLRVASDKLDVRAPSDAGEVMSTLKATGKVVFVTPGGEGVCEELNILPNSGQVQVVGAVHFKYHWGKVETSVTGERMTFRLGSLPGTLPATEPAAVRSLVPANYERTR